MTDIEFLEKFENLPSRSMNKQQWVRLLESTGMSEAHQDFLESLDIPEQEIKTIRSRSKEGQLLSCE
jgi:hypothetical protein